MKRNDGETNIPFPPMMPQPQMVKPLNGEEPDPSMLPHFQEPENEKEDDKVKLKEQVEAIMARREAMVGSKAGGEKEK